MRSAEVSLYLKKMFKFFRNKLKEIKSSFSKKVEEEIGDYFNEEIWGKVEDRVYEEMSK